MPACADCGGPVENKNAAGHYRDRCHACIREAADGDAPAKLPMHGCECPECEAARA